MSLEEVQDFPALRQVRDQLTRFMMSYKFGLDEVLTKINILRDEFTYIHDYNPIEHVNSRLKTPESILEKAIRKGCEMELDQIRAQVLDIAGVRVSCSFVSDIYKVREMLVGQADLTLIVERDYIANPKPNGYQSLHLIVQVPVFLSDRVENVTVEIQLRTIAMDFWASLEHKIYYKYNKSVPDGLVAELKAAAVAAAQLDRQMERLHETVKSHAAESDDNVLLLDQEPTNLMPSRELIEAFLRSPRANAQTGNAL